MIKMIDKELDCVTCERNLDELNVLLSKNTDLDELGPNGLQEFFWSRPDLLILIGDCFGIAVGKGKVRFQKELSIYQEFRTDFAVASLDNKKILFIEFEDAKENSVFEIKTDGKTAVSYQWGTRFEHGFSQVVDWYYRLEDMIRTNKMTEHFGVSELDFKGILVVGRSTHINKTGNKNRFEWRKKKTVIDSKELKCLTFDNLKDEMVERFDAIKMMKSGKL